MTEVVNRSGVVLTTDGRRLFGFDAELYRKQERRKDVTLEASVKQWIEQVVGHALSGDTLWVCLRNGHTLIQMLNTIKPGVIPKWNKKLNCGGITELDNIQLYLKGCWKLGIQSKCLFGVQDLHKGANMDLVCRNIMAVSELAPKFGVRVAPLDECARRAPTLVSLVDPVPGASSSRTKTPTELRKEISEAQKRHAALEAQVQEAKCSLRQLKGFLPAEKTAKTSEPQNAMIASVGNAQEIEEEQQRINFLREKKKALEKENNSLTKAVRNFSRYAKFKTKGAEMHVHEDNVTSIVHLETLLTQTQKLLLNQYVPVEELMKLRDMLSQYEGRRGFCFILQQNLSEKRQLSDEVFDVFVWLFNLVVYSVDDVYSAQVLMESASKIVRQSDGFPIRKLIRRAPIWENVEVWKHCFVSRAGSGSAAEAENIDEAIAYMVKKMNNAWGLALPLQAEFVKQAAHLTDLSAEKLQDLQRLVL